MDRETAEPHELIHETPTFTNPAWLPLDSGIEWLDDLGRDHRRLLAAQAATASERARLAAQFEQEDEDRREALAVSLRTGRDADVPDPTTPDQRAAALAELDQRLAAHRDALAGFIRDAIQTLEEQTPGWLADISASRAEAVEKRLEAQRLLAEADAQEARMWRLGEWVKRNGGVHERASFRNVSDFRFVTWAFVTTLTPRPTQPDVDEVLRAISPQ